eukprot:TRINITY_DN34656_c0_g1_i1.p1 TRINITY_DN34656_c0_g1~~TRINITY_DN34656_c0_g1_i1.p1  ORF type:complete len:106 (+),score=6.71 TRINITY_DN34656_c0_g1_i1:1011-1328(+)
MPEIVTHAKHLLQKGVNSSASPQHLANLGWAVARTGLRDVSLMDLIATTAISMVDRSGPLEVPSLAWAYATISYRSEPLLEAVKLATKDLLCEGRLGPQGLSNLV